MEYFTSWLRPLYRLLIGASPALLEISVTVRGPAERGSLFSDVFRAVYKHVSVCAKRLRIFEDPETRREIHEQIIKDARSWKNLKHPFVLEFIGVDRTTFSPMLALVVPWCERGSIIAYLKSRSSAQADLGILTLEIAQALAYLHKNNFVHGDIRGANILIDDEGHAQVTDYGLVQYAEAAMSRMAVPANRYGGGRWTAPELHYPEKFNMSSFERTFESDTFAFGMLVVEIYTENPPFANITHDAAVYFKIIEGERPPRPSSDQCPRGTAPSDHLWSLVEHCWVAQPKERPAMKDIELQLNDDWEDLGTVSRS